MKLVESYCDNITHLKLFNHIMSVLSFRHFYKSKSSFKLSLPDFPTLIYDLIHYIKKIYQMHKSKEVLKSKSFTIYT